jgi:hypothetical protein
MDEYINSKKIEVRKILIKKAKNKQSTYYSEVMAECHISRRWIGKILGRLGDYCYDHKEPILPALVELKGGGIGVGYKYVVNNCGADLSYKNEQEKCFIYWENKT